MMLESIFFFFNDTATTEIYTLSLHDALPICLLGEGALRDVVGAERRRRVDRLRQDRRAEAENGGEHRRPPSPQDRKSTRLNSSHANISYAVFCLKKKKINMVKVIRRHTTKQT